MKFIVILLLISSVSEAHLSRHLFVEVETLDGAGVSYAPKTTEGLERQGVSVAQAHYDRGGAYIYYDYELFQGLSDLAKFLILEHERAHHFLGHTLSTKEYRERQKPIPSRLTYKKERDADCATGYKLAELSPETTRKDIQLAMQEVLFAFSGETQLQQWVLDRVDLVATCFDGELIPYPSLLESDF